MYTDLLRKKMLSTEVLDCASGKIKAPEFTLDTPFDSSYNFPPFLIPIWSDEGLPGYYGLIFDWFHQHPTSYVKYYAENKSMVEIGRTSEQLFSWLSFYFLCNTPEYDEAEGFAKQTGVISEESLEDHFEDCNNKRDLLYHPDFMESPPEILKQETDNDLLSYAKKIKPFIDLDNRKDIVEELIGTNKIELAWYCLNAPGWSVAQVKPYLRIIAKEVNCDLFSLQIDCWKNCHVDFDRY